MLIDTRQEATYTIKNLWYYNPVLTDSLIDDAITSTLWVRIWHGVNPAFRSGSDTAIKAIARDIRFRVMDTMEVMYAD